mgnify:CR=1 FL=1
MPKRTDIQSVLILGAGPIVIGQACEFDYSGSQAARSLREEGVEVDEEKKLSEGSPNVIDLIKEDDIDLVVNTLTKGKVPARDGFKIRRNAVEMGIPCLTSLDTTEAILEVLQEMMSGVEVNVHALQDYV